MIKSYILFLIISIIINFAPATLDEQCKNQSKTNCETCLKVPGCAYCKNTKECFVNPVNPLDAPCALHDLQRGTCAGKLIRILANAEPEQPCKNQSSTNCDTCLKVSGCAYCKNSKECFVKPLNPLDAPCAIHDLQMETCAGKLIKYYYLLKYIDFR
jgi:hypothetical protein